MTANTKYYNNKSISGKIRNKSRRTAKNKLWKENVVFDKQT